MTKSRYTVSHNPRVVSNVFSSAKAASAPKGAKAGRAVKGTLLGVAAIAVAGAGIVAGGVTGFIKGLGS